MICVFLLFGAVEDLWDVWENQSPPLIVCTSFPRDWASQSSVLSPISVAISGYLMIPNLPQCLHRMRLHRLGEAPRDLAGWFCDAYVCHSDWLTLGGKQGTGRHRPMTDAQIKTCRR